MKLKTQSPQSRIVQQLLGLVLIGLVLWLAAIGWLPVSSAHAGPEGQLRGDPEKQLAHLRTQLNLTAEQVDQIRPILEDEASRRRVLFKAYHGQDRRAMRTEMQKMREETEAALAAVLTEDQMAEWKQLRKSHRGQRFKQPSSVGCP
jgi:hypothetical protein